jgi:ankyrin repeat protein
MLVKKFFFLVYFLILSGCAGAGGALLGAGLSQKASYTVGPKQNSEDAKPLSQKELNNTLLNYVQKGKAAYKITEIIKSGADPNQKIKSGTSLLIIAVKKNFYYIASSLLRNGGAVKFLDSKERSAIFYAKKNRNKKMIQLLKYYSAKKQKEHK